MKLFCVRATRVAVAAAVVSVFATGCGTNQFQQELITEEAAIKLTRETVQGGYQLISTDELKKLLNSGDEFLLVDAMPAAESYDKAHIAGAVNFAFPKEILNSWDEQAIGGKSKEDYAELLGEDKERKIVVYCGFVKCARSHNAAIFARELGYDNVLRYPGGIHAWRGAGNSLTTK